LSTAGGSASSTIVASTTFGRSSLTIGADAEALIESTALRKRSSRNAAIVTSFALSQKAASSARRVAS
jgi:hypothetical protein